MIQETFIEEVGNLLNKLPEKRRKVLEMSVLESKSYAEIADALRISLNTVKDHVKKAYAFCGKKCVKIFHLLYFSVLSTIVKNACEK